MTSRAWAVLWLLAAWWIGAAMPLDVVESVQAQSSEPASLRAALPTPEASWPRACLVEAGAPLVGLPAARVATGLGGEGASVCLVDTGVDLTLPDLRDASHRTRVRWLLDLDAPPRGVHPELEDEFAAAVYDADDLEALGAAAPGDWHGHGTAMAVLAVGDDAAVGQEEPGPRAGAAPSASLIVVRALRRGVPGFRDDDLSLGVRFCFAVAGLGRAATDGSRTVALLGSGGHDGAHDGTAALERALEAEVASGHAVVVAAGNDGGRCVHAAADVADQARADVPFFVPAPVGAPGARSVALAIFVAPSSDARVALHAPDGTRTPEVAAGQERCVDHSGGRLCVDARAPAADGSRRIHALVLGGGDVTTELAGGRYVLEVTGGGRFDAWVAGVDLGVALGRAEFLGELADGRRSVAIPATAASVLAVGAATSRPPRSASADATCLGCALESSSRGPNRLGQPKPDLIAPGGYVLVPLSSGVRVGDAENLFAGLPPSRVTFVDEEGRVALTGSSFAAPWVAGALALAYSESPADVSRDADLLRATARPSDGWAYDVAAGAGLLDVEAFLTARARVQGAASVGRSSFALSDRGGLWVVRLRDDQGWPARGRVSLTTADGERSSVEVEAGWAVLGPPPGRDLKLSLDGRPWASLGGSSSGCSLALRAERAPGSLTALGLWALLGWALVGSALRRRRSAGRCGRSRPGCPRRAGAPRG